MTDTLTGGQNLNPGDSITSPNGRAELIMQKDGNLVLYNKTNGSVLWASVTVNRGVIASMQTDGNFVVYDSNHKPVWASATQSNPGAYLKVQDDGNLVVYIGTTPKWASGTQDFTRHNQGGGFNISDITDVISQGAGVLAQVGNALGFPGINLNTAIMTGQNPVDALKADVDVFKKDGKLAQMVTSGDYGSAWSLATNNGKIFDPGLPLPAGKTYSPTAQPNTPGVIAQHPAVVAAKAKPLKLTHLVSSPIQVPVHKDVLAAHLGVDASHPAIENIPNEHPGVAAVRKAKHWWEIGGTAGGAAAGFVVGGPLGAAVGALAGWAGGTVANPTSNTHKKIFKSKLAIKPHA